MLRLTEALDVSDVNRVNDMLVQWFLDSDQAPGLHELMDALAGLFGESYKFADEVFDSLECVGADGDVWMALFVLYDMGAIELSGDALDQVLKANSTDPTTGEARAVL